MNGFEFALDFLRGLLVMHQLQQGFGQLLRCSVLLQQFRYDLAPRQDIGQPDIRQADHATHDLPGQLRYAVGNHHRTFEQCGFQRGCAGGNQHRVRRLNGQVSVAKQDVQGQLVSVVAA